MRYSPLVFGQAILAKRPNFAVLLVSLLVGVVAPIAAAQPASALFPCSGNAVCLYQHKDFGGDSLKVTIAGVPVCWNMGYLNNQVSSVINNTYNHVRYYDDANCTGTRYFTDGGGGYRRNLYLDMWELPPNGLPNDAISSFRVY